MSEIQERKNKAVPYNGVIDMDFPNRFPLR